MGTAVAAIRLTLTWSVLLAVAAAETQPLAGETPSQERRAELLPTPEPNPSTDEELAADVRIRLDRDPYVASSAIRVFVRRGVVTLSGPIGSSFLRTWAEDTARGVLGVAAVRNQLVLDHVPPRKRDWQAEEDLRWRLGVSPGIQADRVAVRVADGVVYLTGTVRTEEEERIVVRQARRVAPRLVVNHLAVRDLAPVVRGVPLPAGLPLGPPADAPVE